MRDRLDFVEPAAAGMLDRYRLASGDVACTRTGEIGRGALVTEEHDGWLLGTSCLRLRPGPALDPSYLIFYLGHPRVQRWLVGNAGGSTVRSLTAATMRALPLLLPDNDRQRRIGAAMSALDEQLAIHDRIRRSTSALRESLVPLYLEDSLLDEAPGKIMSPLPFGHPASRQSVPCCRPPGSVSVAHRLPAGTDANIITNKVHYSRP